MRKYFKVFILLVPLALPFVAAPQGVVVVQRRQPVTSGVSDNFNRADSSTSLGTSSSGHTWVAAQGTWGIASNTGYMATTAGDGQNVAYIECSQTDGTIQVTLSTIASGTDAGILFRYVDNSNYYIAIYEQAGLILRIYDRTAGGFTQIGSAVFTCSSGDALSLVMSGSNFDFKINGSSKATASDSTHTGTKHGIRAFQDTVTRFDDFSFTP